MRNIRENKWSEKKGNILPSLLPQAAKDLQRKIAGEWNSKRSSKDIENEVFYTPSDVDYASIEDIVKHQGAKKYSVNAAKYRASQQIRMAEFSKKLTLICPNSGIVSAIDLPSIPGYFMEHEHPLSNLRNCRNLVQKGYAYLLKLDTQVLAALLISLADDYNLFQYPVFSNGTSKNALLRTAGKNTLIKALLYIEEKIHSENYSLLPKLSFIPSDDSKQGEMEARLHNWLILVQKELEAPTIVFEAPTKVQTGLQKAREERKIEAAAEKNARKALLAFNKLLVESIASVKSLYKDGLLNQKLRNLLIGLLEKDVFATLDATTKAKVALKLSTLPTESRITDLIKVFERDTVSNEDTLESVDSAPTQVVVPVKTAFELQNNAEVIRKQNEELRAKRYAAITLTRTLHAIHAFKNPAPAYNSQLLLTMDSSKTNGYSEILLNGEPIPEGRFQLQAIREAFSKVKNYKETPAYVAPAVEESAPVEPIAESVSMTDIGDGISVPTVFWNSMSELRQRIYKRKLLSERK